jgi:UDPglucose 6-dehydrogenase
MQFKIAIVGLGKLGLPMAAVFAEAGHEVFGIDNSRDRITQVNDVNYIDVEPLVADLIRQNRERLVFTDKYQVIQDVDCVYLILPTPSDSDGKFKNVFLLESLELIGRHLNQSPREQAVVIVSTVMPGSTTGELASVLYSQISEPLHSLKRIIYSPEFIALGSVVQNLKYPDMILVGAESKESARSHLQVIDSFTLNNPKVQILLTIEAELAKIAINTFVTMKISFANFIGELARSIPSEVDPEAICAAIGSDSRIGTKYLRPGLGFGGPCFPRDNIAFASFASDVGLDASLAKATDKINQKIPQSISSWLKKRGNGIDKIAILGLTYKEGTAVIEASQSLMLVNELIGVGFTVGVHDPIINYSILELNPEICILSSLDDLSSYDLVIRAVNCPEYANISHMNMLFLA